MFLRLNCPRISNGYLLLSRDKNGRGIKERDCFLKCAEGKYGCENQSQAI